MAELTKLSALGLLAHGDFSATLAHVCPSSCGAVAHLPHRRIFFLSDPALVAEAALNSAAALRDRQDADGSNPKKDFFEWSNRPTSEPTKSERSGHPRQHSHSTASGGASAAWRLPNKCLTSTRSASSAALGHQDGRQLVRVGVAHQRRRSSPVVGRSGPCPTPELHVIRGSLS